MKIWGLPRRSANGHIETGTYVSAIADDAQVFRVSSRNSNGDRLDYVRIEIDSGDATINVAIIEPRKLAERLIEVTDQIAEEPEGHFSSR